MKRVKNKLRKNKELWTVLTKAISKSNSTEYSDYHYLYEKTLTGKYKCILELGSGISSRFLHLQLNNYMKRGKKTINNINRRKYRLS